MLFFRNFILKAKYNKEIVRSKFNISGSDRFSKIILKKIKKGFYLDCGCYHPFKFSLTKALYDSGWKGICLDISKDTIDLFRMYRPRDISLNVGLFTKTGKQTAYFEKEISQVTSLDKNFLKELGRKIKFKKTINTITLKDLRKEYGIKKIDFLKIDCENIDEKIIINSSYLELDAEYLSIEYLPKLKKDILKLTNDDFLKILKKSRVYKKLIKRYSLIDNHEYTFLFQKNSRMIKA